MNQRVLGEWKCVASLALLAAGTVGLLFFLQGRVGFSLWDEGHLWYGVQQVLDGRVPIRDFRSYDPARYYYSAGFLTLIKNHGILALRSSIAFVQVLGLFSVLMLIRKNMRVAPLYFLWMVPLLALWMFPLHKLYDITVSILFLGMLTRVIRNPSVQRWAWLGFGVGFCACVGRNHGFYAAISSFFAALYLAVGNPLSIGFFKKIGFFSLGVLVGYLPVLFQILFVPNFFRAFMDGLFLHSTLPIPIPWPWLFPLDLGGSVEGIRYLLIGLFFIVLLLYGFGGLIAVFYCRLRRRPLNPLLVASTILALPYAHHALSRADVSHLAQGVFPFLIGSFVFFSGRSARIRAWFLLLLVGSSLFIMLPAHPGWRARSGQGWVEANVGESSLVVSPAVAENLDLLGGLFSEYCSNGESFYVAPYWPGAYALFEQTAPCWDIYPLFSRSAAFQREEIVRLKHAAPAFVIVLDMPLDNLEERSFKNTNPLIEAYIRENYRRLSSKNPWHQIYEKESFQGLEDFRLVE